MRAFRRVAVFCGSSDRVGSGYRDAARQFGRLLAERGIDLVYGGGRVGLMGEVADGALSAGARVYGVIPERLRAREVAHPGLTELFVVTSMHARKQIMSVMADGFVVLPGGFGTLDETFEAVTWTQLGYHRKPVGLLDVGGFFERLVGFLDHAAAEGFVRPVHRDLLLCDSVPARLLDRMATVDLPEFHRWIEAP